MQAVQLINDPGHIGGPVVVPNGVRVILTWTTPSGKGAKNILGGSVSGGFTPTVAICNSIMTQITSGATWTAFNALLTPGGALASVSLLDLRTANLPLVTSSNAAVPGASASAALPNEMAVAVTFRTGRTGPGGRGRMYVPNLAEGNGGAGNTIVAGAVTAIGNWALLVQTALLAQGITQAIVLPARNAYMGATGTQHPARAASVLPISSILVRDNHWDSQRRRGLK